MSYPNPPGDQPAYQPAPGYGPPPGYPASGQPSRLRGRTPRRLGWIFLAAAVILFVIGGVVAATKSLNKVSGFQRIPIATGSGSVNLNTTGKWVVYYEASNVDNGIDRIPTIQLAIKDPSGARISGSPYGNRSDGKVKKFVYDYKGHKGAAAYQFNVSKPGTYQVQVRAVDTLPSGADLAFGRDITKGAIAAGLLIVGGVLFLIAAIVLLIVGFVKRGRHKREFESASAGYAAPQFGGPPPGGQWGQQPGYQPAARTPAVPVTAATRLPVARRPSRGTGSSHLRRPSRATGRPPPQQG